MMDRKQRIDTVAGAIATMGDALSGPLDPPDHVNLRQGDRPFWDSIVGARARGSWDNADLEIAGNLARCKADIERIQSELDIEGDTLTNDRGTVVMNPKHSLLETLSRRAVALSRMLHVHAEAKQGESREQGKRLSAERESRDVIDKKPSLIARPAH